MADDSQWEAWQQLIGREDVDALEVMAMAAMYERYFDEVQRHAARVARAQGRSWQEIADAVGTTKQTAWKKWRPPPEAADTQGFAELPVGALAQGILRPFEPLVQQVVDSACRAGDAMRPELVEAARRALDDAIASYGASGKKAPFAVYASWWIRQGVTRRKSELRSA
jgi:hypothetical protein